MCLKTASCSKQSEPALSSMSQQVGLSTQPSDYVFPHPIIDDFDQEILQKNIEGSIGAKEILSQSVFEGIISHNFFQILPSPQKTVAGKVDLDKKTRNEETKYWSMTDKQLQEMEIQGRARGAVDRRECIKNIDNWRVVSTRLAPFEQTVEGSPKTWKEYAKKVGVKDFEHRVIHLRFVIQAFCPFRGVDDSAFHVTYLVTPKNLKNIHKSIVSAAGIGKLSEAGDDKGANSLAKDYVSALASDDYQKWHSQFLKKWVSQMSNLRSGIETQKFSFFNNEMNKSVDLINDKITESDIRGIGVRGPNVTHPVLSEKGKEFYNFVLDKVLPSSTLGVVSGFSLSSLAFSDETWAFSNFSVGPISEQELNEHFNPEDREKARKVYKDIHPTLIRPKFAQLKGKRIQVKPTAELGFYNHVTEFVVDSFHPIEAVKKQIVDTKAFDKQDFIFNSGPALSQSGSLLSTEQTRKKLIDLEGGHLTTMACSTCHLMQINSGNNFIPTTAGAAFQMLGEFGRRINPRTALEVQHEAKLVNELIK